LAKFEGNRMTAYWVARSRINDPVEYKKYTDRVPAIIARYGGKVLARGGDFKILEGPETFHRFVVIEFPSLAAAEEGQGRWSSSSWRAATPRSDHTSSVVIPK
jgi:uncharacterized protein (DUF1330 family)